MHIIVATLEFGDLPYFRYAAQINQEYCAHYGYRFEVIRPPRQIHRSPIWFKVDGVTRLLNEASVVLFLDADAYFVDFSQSIESLVSEHMGDALILLGTDRRDKAFGWSDDNANCGVFVVRHSSDTFELLTEWWNVPTEIDKQWLWRWPPEQGAFNQYVRVGRHANKIKVIPYFYLNGLDGKYIRHLVGCSEGQRLMRLRQDAKTLACSLRTGVV